MKIIKKGYFICIIIGIMLCTCTIPKLEVEAENTMDITIHYKRYDGIYENWSVWIWADGKEGNAYEFTEEDEYGKVCKTSIEITDDTEKIGFLVRLGEWEKKDIEQDRFISITEKQTSVEFFLLEADEKIYEQESEVDLTPKIQSATFPKNKQIDFKLTKPYNNVDETDTSKVQVRDQNGVEYEILKVWSKEAGMISEGTIVMKEELDLANTYTLEMEGYLEKEVSLGAVFSSSAFEELYNYEGEDLGAIYQEEETNFCLWAPTASKVELNLYEEGLGGKQLDKLSMQKGEKGIWRCSVRDDLKNVYYTYSVTVGKTTSEAVDPYAKAVGVNGLRGMVVNLSETDPEGWEEDERPKLANEVDAVIYELHIRDLGMDDSSGIEQKGKFLSLTEKGTTNKEGFSTGLDHILDLGVTHVHLLPIFDFATIDETKLDSEQFNWGYDPQNYNVPEGSYSTDPYHGEVRIQEMKEMILELHKNDLAVVMDVVYNHTAATNDSNFNRIVPDYYYRKDGDTFSNGSGCGNEVASDRAMVRKFIVDSVVYWANEYHIDGFRFDLMGLMDLETMKEIREALDEINPDILLYGEGWTAGTSTLSSGSAALKSNISKLEGIAVFSDDIRDGIKGSVFEAGDTGYVSGKNGLVEQIKFGVVGATEQESVDYKDHAWASAPTQTINYASAHDNLSLWDKLAVSQANRSEEDRKRMNQLSAAIVMTSQGIPFFQAGEEFLRTKPDGEGGFDENSYKSSDVTNALKWNEKTKNMDIYEYYRGLLAFRKEHAGLRMQTKEEIAEQLQFLETVPENVVAYTIRDTIRSQGEEILIIYNPNEEDVEIDLPSGVWDVYVNNEQAGTKRIETISDASITVERISAMCLVKKKSVVKRIFVYGILGVVCTAFGVRYMIKRKKKRK